MSRRRTITVYPWGEGWLFPAKRYRAPYIRWWAIVARECSVKTLSARDRFVYELKYKLLEPDWAHLARSQRRFSINRLYPADENGPRLMCRARTLTNSRKQTLPARKIVNYWNASENCTRATGAAYNAVVVHAIKTTTIYARHRIFYDRARNVFQMAGLWTHFVVGKPAGFLSVVISPVPPEHD